MRPAKCIIVAGTGMIQPAAELYHRHTSMRTEAAAVLALPWAGFGDLDSNYDQLAPQLDEVIEGETACIITHSQPGKLVTRYAEVHPNVVRLVLCMCPHRGTRITRGFGRLLPPCFRDMTAGSVFNQMSVPRVEAWLTSGTAPEVHSVFTVCDELIKPWQSSYIKGAFNHAFIPYGSGWYFRPQLPGNTVPVITMRPISHMLAFWDPDFVYHVVNIANAEIAERPAHLQAAA